MHDEAITLQEELSHMLLEKSEENLTSTSPSKIEESLKKTGCYERSATFLFQAIT